MCGFKCVSTGGVVRACRHGSRALDPAAPLSLVRPNLANRQRLKLRLQYFHGNCGTGGGVVNAGGELVVYCPHDAAGVHAFGAPSATNFTELRLLDRAPAKIAMPMPPASALPAGDGTSDPGTPFLASDGKWYQVLGGRGKASDPTCHRTDRMSHCCQ